MKPVEKRCICAHSLMIFTHVGQVIECLNCKRIITMESEGVFVFKRPESIGKTISLNEKSMDRILNQAGAACIYSRLKYADDEQYIDDCLDDLLELWERDDQLLKT